MTNEIDYQPPIVISRGGVYSGNWKSDGNSSAVLITTSEKVEIMLSNIVGIGNQPAIKMYGYTSTNIHHNTITQQYGADGGQLAKAVNNYRPRNFVFENNDVNGGSGILVDHMDDTPYADSILIRFNRGRNMSKAKADGSNGGDHAQFIQFNTVRGFKAAEISWNECINEPGKSWIEDNISIINSTGKTPLTITSNYLEGAYPMPADQGEGFTGSGITVETNDNNAVSDGVLITGNVVTRMGNALLNITSSRNVVATGNRLICASTLPDGSRPRYFWSGTCIYNGSGISEADLATSQIAGNVIGYARYNDGGNQFPYPQRQDVRFKFGNTNWDDNRMEANQNTYLPNVAITRAMEDAEYATWLMRVKNAKLTIGNTLAPIVLPAKKVLRTGYFTLNKIKKNYIMYDDGTWAYK